VSPNRGWHLRTALAATPSGSHKTATVAGASIFKTKLDSGELR
jgi:hypothetical protein